MSQGTENRGLANRGILILCAVAAVISPVGGCSPSTTQEWTALQFDGASLAVPVDWRLEWWPALGAKWTFRVHQAKDLGMVEVMGADLSGSLRGNARAWLSWFSTQYRDGDDTLGYSEHATVEATVVCVRQGEERVFAACVRQPSAAEPQASAVAYVLNRRRDLFEQMGGLPLLVDVAGRTSGFAYILCVRGRGEAPNPACPRRR